MYKIEALGYLLLVMVNQGRVCDSSVVRAMLDPQTDKKTFEDVRSNVRPVTCQKFVTITRHQLFDVTIAGL